MQTADIALLFDHLYWVRDRILDAATSAAPTVLIDADAPTIRDLRTSLVHELDVEWSWRMRLTGVPPDGWDTAAELRAEDYPTVDAIGRHWRRDEAEMRTWLTSLTHADLAAPVTRNGLDGLPMWAYLIHLTTHAIQQFSDAATLLTRAGTSPGGIEFLDFMKARGFPAVP